MLKLRKVLQKQEVLVTTMPSVYTDCVTLSCGMLTLLSQ